MLVLFHSLDFIRFFIAVFLLYWLLPQKRRNALLLLASYLFYSSWDYRFLSLMLISTFANYVCGIRIHESTEPAKRRLYLLISLAVSLSLLGLFKYFNFFVENLVSLLNLMGLSLNYTTLDIILPLGISFYTFQALSYTIDIYRKKIAPTRNIVDFSLFIAYFPQLIAGPIERARNLIPQLEAEKSLMRINAVEGLYLFLYGAFKKVVIADSFGALVDMIYAMPNPSGAHVLLALYAFAIQIYCDFSGYSNMARGISNFFGIKLSVNFNLPFFSEDVQQLIKRWHITLTSWIWEYVYVPLFLYLPSRTMLARIGNSRLKYYLSAMATTFITLLVFGLWHGAAWNFVLNGVYLFAVIMAFNVAKLAFDRYFKSGSAFMPFWVVKPIKTLVTLNSLLYGLLLFRARSIHQILVLTGALFSGISFRELFALIPLQLYVLALFLVLYEAVQYFKNDQLLLCRQPAYAQVIFYITLFFIYLWVGASSENSFIYFQF